MVGIDVTELPLGYATFFQQCLKLFDLAVVNATYNVLGRDYSRHGGAFALITLVCARNVVSSSITSTSSFSFA